GPSCAGHRQGTGPDLRPDPAGGRRSAQWAGRADGGALRPAHPPVPSGARGCGGGPGARRRGANRCRAVGPRPAGALGRGAARCPRPRTRWRGYRCLRRHARHGGVRRRAHATDRPWRRRLRARPAAAVRRPHHRGVPGAPVPPRGSGPRRSGAHPGAEARQRGVAGRADRGGAFGAAIAPADASCRRRFPAQPCVVAGRGFRHPAGAMGKADRKTVLSARLVAALLAGVLLIMGLNSLLFAARRDPDFPRLSENLAASSGLEVRRQIKGEIEAMFALPAREELIVVAGGYLWRFSADGRLLDTLDMPGAMHRNGIAFDEDGYVDWVHTGVRDRKPYAPAVDGNGLEPAQLEAALSAARIVAYGKDDTFAWAWLWDGDRAWRMDISRHRERVDTYCTPRSSTDDHVRWADTCLKGLAAPDPGMVEILPRSFAQGDPGGKRSVEVVGFDRRRYHMEGGAIANVLETVAGGVAKVIAPHLPGGPPERYWVGDAHTRMRLGDEVLQFKVVVARDAGDYEFLHAVDWWDPSSVIAGASPWLRVRMRDGMERAGEGALWALYREDLG